MRTSRMRYFTEQFNLGKVSFATFNKDFDIHKKQFDSFFRDIAIKRHYVKPPYKQNKKRGKR